MSELTKYLLYQRSEVKKPNHIISKEKWREKQINTFYRYGRPIFHVKDDKYHIFYKRDIEKNTMGTYMK